MKYEYLLVGALAVAVLRPQGTVVRAEDGKDRTEARTEKRDEASPRQDAKDARARKKRKEQGQGTDAQRNADRPSEADKEGANKRKATGRAAKPAKDNPLETMGSQSMNAATARAAGEAARREQEPSREVSVQLSDRAPRSVARAKKKAALETIDRAHAPAGEGEIELGAHSSKPVEIPAYNVGTQPSPTLNETPEERALRERVQTQLMKNEELSRSEQLVQVRVEGQVVTLGGQVGTTYERYRVERTVREIPEVTEVQNRIRARNALGEKPEWRD